MRHGRRGASCRTLRRWRSFYLRTPLMPDATLIFTRTNWPAGRTHERFLSADSLQIRAHDGKRATERVTTSLRYLTFTCSPKASAAESQGMDEPWRTFTKAGTRLDVLEADDPSRVHTCKLPGHTALRSFLSAQHETRLEDAACGNAVTSDQCC